MHNRVRMLTFDTYKGANNLDSTPFDYSKKLTSDALVRERPNDRTRSEHTHTHTHTRARARE